MSSDTIFREYRPTESERSARSAGDRLRHRQKVRESIRENIADIIAEESIIGKNKDKVIKVPLRGIKEYRFVYGDNVPGVGTGDGNAQPGQVVGKVGKEGQGKGEGQAGDRPGVDYYETDVTLEELIEIMFEDLELPNLERRALREIPAERITKRKGYRHVGIRVRLDKRRTARQRVVRMLASQRGGLSAAAAAKAKSGAPAPTAGSGASAAANGSSHGADLDDHERRFPFHQDDLRYKHLAEICNLFGYGEIKPLGSRYYESSMLNVFRRLEEPNFQAVLIERKEDIWPSFKAFLSKDRVKE